MTMKSKLKITILKVSLNQNQNITKLT